MQIYRSEYSLNHLKLVYLKINQTLPKNQNFEVFSKFRLKISRKKYTKSRKIVDSSCFIALLINRKDTGYSDTSSGLYPPTPRYTKQK